MFSIKPTCCKILDKWWQTPFTFFNLTSQKCWGAKIAVAVCNVYTGYKYLSVSMAKYETLISNLRGLFQMNIKTFYLSTCGLQSQTCNGTQEDEKHRCAQRAGEKYAFNTEKLVLQQGTVSDCHFKSHWGVETYSYANIVKLSYNSPICGGTSPHYSTTCTEGNCNGRGSVSCSQLRRWCQTEKQHTWPNTQSPGGRRSSTISDEENTKTRASKSQYTYHLLGWMYLSVDRQVSTDKKLGGGKKQTKQSVF